VNDHDHHGDHEHHGFSFDERAATWDDDPAKVERARVVADAIRDAVAPNGTTRLLEYGAGTGLVTQGLRDHVGPVTLADTSSGMREMIEKKIEAGVLEGARVWDVDLAVDPAPDETFDLIVTVMTLHHINPLDRVLSAFAALLVSGGHLCVVDLEAEDGSFHGEGFEGHHGFSRTELEAQLKAAGFRDIVFTRCHEVTRETGTYPLFLATGAR